MDESDPTLEAAAALRRLRLRAERTATRVIVLHGPDGDGKSALAWELTDGVGKSSLARELADEVGRSALARELADDLGDRHGMPVHWIAWGDRPVDRDQLLLRVLRRAGDFPVRSLCTALLSRPRDLTSLTGEGSPPWERGGSVIVVDGLRVGARDNDLLQQYARLLAPTRHILIVTTRTSDAVTGDDPAIVRHEVTSANPTVTTGRAPLTHQNADLLEALAVWQGVEFSLDTVPPFGSSTPAQIRTSLERLHRYGLLRPLRPGWYELHPAVRAMYRRLLDNEELRVRAEKLDTRFAEALMGEPGELGDAAELLVDLALRLANSASGNSAEFTQWLAHRLAAEGALFPLLMLKTGLRSTADGTLGVTLARAVRQAGQPEDATRALERLDTPDAVRELAVTRHHMGLLSEAEATLDTLPADRPDGWALHTRAAIRIDRGEPHDVGRLLRLAIETHQVRGDLRGEAWAVFHYGRLRMLRGDLEEARKRLDTAGHMFRDVGDPVGTAWADTELCRVALLLRGLRPDVVRELEAMPAAHEHHGDARGAAWARLLLGVAYADAGDAGDPEATKALAGALGAFKQLPDRVGAGWAALHTALRLGGYSDLLRMAAEAFREATCRHGAAWTLLQEAVQGRARRNADARRPALEAQRIFESIDDSAGPQWVTAVLCGPGSVEGMTAIRALAECYPPQALRDIDWHISRLRIPHAILRLRPEPGAFADHTEPDALPSAIARVRLTLLDDSPTPDRAAHITLHIEPGPDHIWSAPEATTPLLTVRATPLTQADVEPSYSLPVRIDRTALFRFTPRTTGRHRIRFTVEHEASGTVLQQVETDIDVTGPSESPPLAAPQPEPVRRA
ncbi:tetratricopeptide repeat protein [Streptomyces fulvoviolaceus]|uniref:tetratricopeptide repeat protein n=1 Tax=Streptomyces fulvoviolaceus TaxID=285535 RepID=UPI0021C0B964|nr:tetratricopeptide repeat protein [Streptomyces fulvoviolaceus]MCT9081419.1 tetratricopeptide repeat protein [Streptomyces fulvoviolaceus]